MGSGTKCTARPFLKHVQHSRRMQDDLITDNNTNALLRIHVVFSFSQASWRIQNFGSTRRKYRYTCLSVAWLSIVSLDCASPSTKRGQRICSIEVDQERVCRVYSYNRCLSVRISLATRVLFSACLVASLQSFKVFSSAVCQVYCSRQKAILAVLK